MPQMPPLAAARRQHLPSRSRWRCALLWSFCTARCERNGQIHLWPCSAPHPASMIPADEASPGLVAGNPKVLERTILALGGLCLLELEVLALRQKECPFFCVAHLIVSLYIFRQGNHHHRKLVDHTSSSGFSFPDPLPHKYLLFPATPATGFDMRRGVQTESGLLKNILPSGALSQNFWHLFLAFFFLQKAPRMTFRPILDFGGVIL